MDPQVTVALGLFELLIIAFLVILIHLCVKYCSRFGHLESTQSIWPRASKMLLTPAKWGFPLWLLYGICFNCLTRSLIYSLLQLVNVFRPNERLGLVGDFIVTCICTFVGSFAATALYKLYEGSHSILFSVTLAICVIPTGITLLIIRSGLNSTVTEMDSVWNWVLGVVSIMSFSLLASFIVFKFINVSYSMLWNYSLEKFESQQTPPSPGEPTQESTQQDSVEPRDESSSTQEGSNKPIPTLKEFIDNGSTLEDVLKTLIETQKPNQPQNQKTQKKQWRQRSKGETICTALGVSVLMQIVIGAFCGIVNMNAYGKGNEVLEISYLVTVLINLTQFISLMRYAVIFIYVQSALVADGFSLTNWCWYVLVLNLPCFFSEYLKDISFASPGDDEFLTVELLRVPFKFAAVGFIASAIYYIVCLKKAKEILSAAEPHELDSFNVEPQTA